MAYASWSVTYGEQPSAAKWNILGSNDAHFYGFLGDNEAWQSWTPTFVNLSGGTLNYSDYTAIGNTVFYRLKYSLAGAGVAGAVTFTLPVAENTEYDQAGVTPMGTAVFRDTGTTVFDGVVVWSSSGIAEVRAKAVSTYVTMATQLSSTVPMTWANTDQIHISGFYESAT